jgi:hypothetical protein
MIRFLIPIFLVASLALSFFPGQLKAGDGGVPAPRREFRQSEGYPYTFVPVTYLETGGPKGMRFAQHEGDCSHRDAPALPSPTPIPESKPVTEYPESQAAATTAATGPTPVAVAPAFPPPANAPSAAGPDLTRMPDEVMSYFKNPYNSEPRGAHLFDPIFEPVYHQGPQSKATYQLSDKP